MKKESKLVEVLEAEFQRALWLWFVQRDIDDGDFEGAMYAQFEFLRWTDEVMRLLDGHETEYWTIRFAMFGEKWGK